MTIALSGDYGKPRPALVIQSDTFYLGQMRWMAALAAWHAVPAIGPLREFAAAGRLVTYAPSITEVVRQADQADPSRFRGPRPHEHWRQKSRRRQ